MALIKFGMMMTDARGKLGGHVFTKARNGATVRTKVTPVNPQTTAQQLARSIFGTLSQAWRSLAEDDRASWNSAVSNFSRTNIFGDSYLPSGKNLFVALNSNLVGTGQSQIDIAPLPSDLPDFIISSATLDTNSQEFEPNFVGLEPGVGFAKVIEATAPFSPGRYNFSGSFAKITSYTAGTTPLPSVLYDAYTAKYGVPPTGTKIAVRVFCVDILTGQKSVPSQTTLIVTNTP